MALGYEGYVSLKADAIENVALGTGGSVPQARQRLESSSGYKGAIKTPVADIGIGLPNNYDWTAWDGTMDFEVHTDFLTNQIIAWIFDRQKAGIVSFQTRGDNVQLFNNCYWNSINLAASENSALAGSIGFSGMNRDSYVIGGDYIGNKTGGNTLCDNPLFPESLSSSLAPVPYWNTSIEMDSALVDFTSWNLDFSQDVVKFFGCENNVLAVEPKYVAVGPMSINFSGDYMFVNSGTFLSPDELIKLEVRIDKDNEDIKITLEDLELTTSTDALQGPDSMTPISVEYAAYTIVQ